MVGHLSESLSSAKGEEKQPPPFLPNLVVRLPTLNNARDGSLGGMKHHTIFLFVKQKSSPST